MNGKIGLSHMEKHRYEPVRNASNVRVPPFAPLLGGSISEEAKDFAINNAQSLLVHPFTKQPSFLGQTPGLDAGGFGFNSPMLVNGPAEIAPGGVGHATRDWPAPAMVADDEYATKNLVGLPLFPRVPDEVGVAADSFCRFPYDLIGWRPRFSRLYTSFPIQNFRYSVDQGLYIDGAQDLDKKRTLAWLRRPDSILAPGLDSTYVVVDADMTDFGGTFSHNASFPPVDWIRTGVAEADSIVLYSPGIFEVALTLIVSGAASSGSSNIPHSNVSVRLANLVGESLADDVELGNLSSIDFTAAPQVTRADCSSNSSGCTVLLTGAAFEQTYSVTGRIYVTVVDDWRDSFSASQIAARLQLKYSRSGDYPLSVTGGMTITRLTRSTLLQDNESEE